MSCIRRLFIMWTIPLLILAGCASESPTPTLRHALRSIPSEASGQGTAATTTTPPAPTPSPTNTPTRAPSTDTPTPTTVLATATTIPAATTRTPTPRPTTHPMSVARVPRPVAPISPSNAAGMSSLAHWSSDKKQTQVIFAPDGRLMAVTSSLGVHLYDAETLEEVGFMDNGGHRVTGLAFLSGGKTLALGSIAMGVRLWQVSECTDHSQKCGAFLGTHRENTDPIKTLGPIAFSPDGKTLAAETNGNAVGIWRISQCDIPAAGCGERLHTLELGRESLDIVAFSADGQILLTATGRNSTFGGDVQLWRVAKGELVAGRRDSYAAFSPDGTILASAGDDNKIILWQASSGMPLLHLIGHTKDTRSVAFAPDGSMLASCAMDDTIRLWRTSDGTLLHTWSAQARDLTFSPDNAWLISTWSNGTIEFWGIDPSSPAPSVPPTPSPTPRASSPFTRADGAPAGEIHQLWTAPDGQLWLVSETGIYIKTENGENGWTPIYNGLANRVLGTDDTERIWALFNDGWRIAAYTDTQWTFYNAEQGWEPGYAHSFITDRLGRVWVAAGEEVRRFDPETQTWTTYSASDVGFEPLEGPPVYWEPHRSLTDLALDSAGNLWVGSCIHDGIMILGQGARWFDGENWSGPADTAGECVHDIEVDQAGRVWMSGFDALIQYDPADQAWSRIPLPPWERTQLIDSVTLDEAGNPWVVFTRFGGTGPWHSNALYHLQDGAWIADYDPGHEMPFSWVFDSDGSIWLCDQGTIYHLADGQQELIDYLGWCRQILLEDTGRVWVNCESGLWWFSRREKRSAVN